MHEAGSGALALQRIHYFMPHGTVRHSTRCFSDTPGGATVRQASVLVIVADVMDFL